MREKDNTKEKPTAALLRLSADLAATLDESEVCQRVVKGLHDTLGYDIVAIDLVDKITGDRVNTASIGYVAPPTRFAPGEGLSERPILDGQLHYTSDVTQDPRYFYGMGGSEVDVPIIIGGEVLGVLIAEKVQRDAFDQNDMEVLTAAAQQTGLAIEKARLLAAERQRADELEALRTTMADITSELKLSDLLLSIIKRATELSQASGGELGLYDESSQEIKVVVSHNTGKDYVGTCLKIGEGLMGHVAESGKALIIEDYQTWEARAPQYADIQMHASMAAPLTVGHRLVGVINIGTSDQARKFSSANLHLLTQFAQQAAIAIENARLFEETRSRTEELAVLNELAQAFTTQLSLEGVLNEVYHGVSRLLDTTNFYIAIYDQEKDEVTFPVNISESKIDSKIIVISADQGITGHIIRNRESVLLEDNVVERSKEIGIEYAGEPSLSYLGVPLLIGDRVLGVMAIQSFTTPRLYGEHAKSLLVSIASQAAVAIENARLFENAGREIAERKKVERELRRQKEYYEALFVNSPVAVVTVDLDGIVVSWNPAAEKLFGYSRVEAIGRDVDDLVANDDSIRAEAVLYTDMLRGDPMARDWGRMRVATRRTRKDGTMVDVEFLGLPVIVAGESVGAIVIYYDLTERVRAETELRKYQEHLEDLVEERTAELRESEERHRTLFDGVPVGLYRTTPAGKIVDANLALVQMLDYPSRENYLSVHSTDVYVNPEERARWQVILEKEGVVRDFETQLRRHDGTVVWVNDTARAVKDMQGQVLYYEGSVEDITERKQAETELRKYQEHLEDLVEERTAELRESEERYRTLFDGVPVGLYRNTPEGQILDINLATVQMTGYASREELLAVSSASLYLNAEDRNQWKLLMEREGVVRDFEFQARQYDGTVRWISDTSRAVRDKTGQILYYEGSLEDITERKRIEEELRRQKEYFEALFINSPVAVVTVDMDANVAAWNPAAEKLFGYTQAEAIGRNVDDLVARDPLIRAEAADYTNRMTKLGVDRVQGSTKRTRIDGSLVDVEVLGVPLIVAGERIGFTAIYMDITELQESRRKAEAASQAKSTFLANMSHELRTPLNAILGFTQLMGDDLSLNAEQRENLGIINRSGKHLLTLINDVLEMSKIEAGRVTLQETDFDLYSLLEGLEEMFKLLAESKGLVLRFERAENLPQYIRADEGKLRQVLSNLLGNAVKFTQEGNVVLRVSAFSPDLPIVQKQEINLYFEVDDTGPGIPPEELATVFDPFTQAIIEQGSQEGTGLGLSISRQYVRLMGGEITASSQLGQGSLFKFDTLVKLAKATEIQETQIARKVIAVEPGQAAYRILVVEDKETNRRLLVKMLEPLGFEVKDAGNGQEAIEIWELWEPHLIWMDMRMPIMDGYEATRRIKSTTKGQATAIIALTASAFEEDRERVLSEGCDDFVRKPFHKDEIYNMLAKHLGIRFIYAGEAAPPVLARSTQAAAELISALAALPADLVAGLQEATIKADLKNIMTLTDKIRELDPALADTLADLANDFEYKKILTLIEKAGGNR